MSFLPASGPSWKAFDITSPTPRPAGPIGCWASANGNLVVTVKVFGSVATTLSSHQKTKPQADFLPVARVSKLHLTSSEVTGVPSWKFASLSLKVYESLSGEASGIAVARPGCIPLSVPGEAGGA